MRPCWIGMMTIAMMIGVGYLALAGGPGEPILPAGEFKTLVTQDAKAIQTLLAKGLDPKDVKAYKIASRQVRGAAFMIAFYAQNSMTKDNSAKMASLRDTALKLIKAIDDTKLDDAKSLAAALSADPKVDPAAKTDPVLLPKVLEFDNVMRVFSSARLGGFGLENELEEFADVKNWTAPQLETLTSYAYKLAMLGEAAHAYVPEKDEGGQKTRKNWLALSTQFRTTSLALAAAAKGKKEGDLASSLGKLATTCKKCHDVFRDN